MHLPPLQSPFSASYHASGNVAIAPDVVIAPGVVLMADPSSRIVIGAGVCLGLGVVLHAHGGDVVVEAGASLGAGVLVVGQCRIGTQACIGASTTLHNASVPPSQIVPPGSLLEKWERDSQGSSASVENSAQVNSAQVNSAQGFTQAAESSPWDTSPWDVPNPSPPEPPRIEEENPDASATPQPESPQPGDANPTTVTPQASRPENRVPKKVYGKAQFERMRILFMPDQTV